MKPAPADRLEQRIEEVKGLLAKHGLLERGPAPTDAAQRLLEEDAAPAEPGRARDAAAALPTCRHASVLESIPPDDRVLVWGQLKPASRLRHW